MPCRDCTHHEPGWCHHHQTPTGEQATCDEWMREPGADDDKGERDE